jgi:hypothetical protein
VLLFAIASLVNMGADAAVQVTSSGFVVRHEVTIGTSPAKAYDTFNFSG